MWILMLLILNVVCIFVLYKLCDMWITYLTGIDWQQATVLYKLCDMWIIIELTQSINGFKVLY